MMKYQSRLKQAIIFFILAFIFYACSAKPSYPEVQAQGEVIKLDIRAFKEAEPVFYSYMHRGKRIDFFVLAMNGTIQSYFDACARCYPKKMGYQHIDGKLLCRACGMRFSLDSLDGIGSCYPIPLKGRVEGENYIIDKKDIIKGAGYF